MLRQEHLWGVSPGEQVKPLPPHEASVLKGLVGHIFQEMWQL